MVTRNRIYALAALLILLAVGTYAYYVRQFVAVTGKA